MAAGEGDCAGADAGAGTGTAASTGADAGAVAGRAGMAARAGAGAGADAGAGAGVELAPDNCADRGAGPRVERYAMARARPDSGAATRPRGRVAARTLERAGPATAPALADPCAARAAPALGRTAVARAALGARSVTGMAAAVGSVAVATADGLCAATGGEGLGFIAAWPARAGPVPIAASPIDAVVATTSVGADRGNRSCCPVACDAMPLLAAAAS